MGSAHSCALTSLGELHCWGSEAGGRILLPNDLGPDGVLGPVVQIDMGMNYSCALTAGGEVRCWGFIGTAGGPLTPPDDLAPAVQLSVGLSHACALTVSGGLRCWGDVPEIASLPPGAVTAVDFSGRCALLADGSVVCPNNLGFVPSELRPSDVAMAVWPRQLLPGQRAAIRFADLRETTTAFTARIEVFGEGTVDVSSAYRLLGSDGQPLEAEGDANSALVAANSVLVAGNSALVAGNSAPVAGNSVLLTGNSPMVWLEALPAGRGSRLYVRPLQSASGSGPSIRELAQLVELIDVPVFSASTDTLPEGAEEAQIDILLSPIHAGRRVELELTAGGTARAGADYTLAAADSEQGIVLGGEATDEITLLVKSAPTETVRLRLQSRSADLISQGERLLNLRISRYRVISAVGGVVSDSAIEGAVALPRALDFTLLDDDLVTAQQIQVGGEGAFACILLDGGSVSCEGSNSLGRATPPDGLAAVAQLAVGDSHSCALTVLGAVHCWGRNIEGQSAPPDGLGPDGALGRAAQVGVGSRHSCALTVSGRVHCWGMHADGSGDGRSTPPNELGPPDPVVQLGLGDDYSCALTVGGALRCWGANDAGQSSPTVSVEPFAQLAVGASHSCALTEAGEAHCWGNPANDGRTSPPDELDPPDPFVQIGVGDDHSCALTVGGRVHCWGSNGGGRSEPPEPPELDPFAQLMVGDNHSCARTVSGRLHCWGEFIENELPLDAVTAVDASGLCALLADGSVYCPPNDDIVPPELLSGEVVMSVWPRQLQPGERAAIRFLDLRETTGVFTVRIEVFGDGAADVSSYYQLFGGDGTTPLDADPDDGSYEIMVVAGSPPSSGDPPATSGESPPPAWLEATVAGRFSRLYVRPLELIGPSLPIRKAAQPVELGAGQIFTASTDTVTEGAADVEWSILLPPFLELGQRELEFAVSGTALAGADYTLVAADPAQKIVLGGESNSTITLRVDSATTEPLRLLLRIRADDRVSQGTRMLNLRISRYPVAPESGGPADLATALDLTILDDEPLTVQQIQLGQDGDFACIHLNGGSLRCAGDDGDVGRATPPDDLGPVAQLAVGEFHSCAVAVGGRVRCWGNNDDGQAEPPDDLSPVVQVGVGTNFSCALTVEGEVRCWGNNDDGRSDPPDALAPDDLGPVEELVVGREHSCALLFLGEVRCWGSNGAMDTPDDRATAPADNLAPFTQLSVGQSHNCAVTGSGLVHCWGLIKAAGLPGDPPGDLGPIAQLASSDGYSCAVTISGELHCWGNPGFTSPPAELGPDGALGPVAQVGVNRTYACALTVGGTVRCWGNSVPDDIPSLPPGSVTTIDASGRCMVLADGSVYCFSGSVAPSGLGSGDVAMSVSPQQLQPGQRAAIRFADLRETTTAFTVRIEVIGDGDADVSSYYRLLSSTGTLLVTGNSVLLTGDPPMAWLEYLGTASLSRLYVLPLELLSASGSTPSIRVLAQPVELVSAPFLSVSSDTLTEGEEGIQLSIWLPQEHIGLPLELELTVGGTAMAGSDFTLVAADSTPRITLGGEATDEITLAVESAPAEPLRLLLRPRADDRISQSTRFLILRLSRYQVTSETGEPVDLPPPLALTIVDDELPMAQQITGAPGDEPFVCVLLNGGVVRCAGDSEERDNTPPNDLEPVVLLESARVHTCALTVSGRVRCWGFADAGRTTPPADLDTVVQLALYEGGGDHTCALTELGTVRCWGRDSEGQSSPPDDLAPAVQISVGRFHSCALTVAGDVSCWGSTFHDISIPPVDLGPVAQVAAGFDHTCAVTVLGRVRCWGRNAAESMPPDDLGPVAQVVAGDRHSCALTISGAVHCWGDNGSPPDGRINPPDDLPPVAQLLEGIRHTCAVTIGGQLYCWGDVIDIPSLPPGAVKAVAASGACALLADGSVYCPDNPELVPAGLAPSEVVMVVSPRQLLPGQRAAIRFADLRDPAGAFTARIEVFGEEIADVSIAYTLLDRDGRTPLDAEEDANSALANFPLANFPLVAGNSGNSGNSFQLSGNPPMAWLQIANDTPLERLYVRPIELLPAANSTTPSIYSAAQAIELDGGGGVFFIAAPATLTEGAEGTQLSIVLLTAHTGLAVELELTVGGNALAGSDYTLVLADPAPGITLGGGENSPLTLSVASAPAEPLRLLLRPRVDDGVSQGNRLLNLRLSRYRVVSAGSEVTDLPRALNFVIRDDDPPTVQQVLLAPNTFFACALVVGGSLRCGGNNSDGRATPPADLLQVVQFGLGNVHGCALTASGQLRCWGNDDSGRSTPPEDALGPFVQLAVGHDHSCALTDLGAVHCWGYNGNGSGNEPVASGRATPPDELGPDGALGPVAQIGAGDLHSCALTVSGKLRCWGFIEDGRTTPPADTLGRFTQLVVGDDHNCALTDLGAVHCWGSDANSRSTPPTALGPDGTLGAVVQIVAGSEHTCALTVSGAVHCWGYNGPGSTTEPSASGRATPPAGLGPDGELGRVEQLLGGREQTCALTVLGQTHCWGSVIPTSSPPAGLKAIDPGSGCTLLVDGSAFCEQTTQEALPLGLAPGHRVMLLRPQQLQTGQRAAIGFFDPDPRATQFSGIRARIEVIGEGAEDVSSYYRLLSSTGRPLEAEEDGSYLFAGASPMAWLEALFPGRGSRLYVRPTELRLIRNDIALGIRSLAQPIELSELMTGPHLVASTDALTEGGGVAQIDIVLPSAHAGLPLELELAVSGTAMRGTDYTLVAADPKTKITFAGDANTTMTITLQVESAPAEILRLLLRPRADDRISQGTQFLNLRVIRYQVVLASGETAGDLFPSLDLIIRDNDLLLVVEQAQVAVDRNFGCFLLNGGSVRCWGDNSEGRATPPADLGGVAQLALGDLHACALTVSGRVRCWGSNHGGRATPPADLAGVVQLVVNRDGNCAVTMAGDVHCWGPSSFGQSTPPDDLGPDGALGAVAQVAVGSSHNCALTVSGAVRCWGIESNDRSTPPDDLGPDGALGAVAQIAVGERHSCALTVLGVVRCWGQNGNGQTTLPSDLASVGPVAQIGMGEFYSCALTVSGKVRCWGKNNVGQTNRPADNLGPFVQLAASGYRHACALTVSGDLRCWGQEVPTLSSLLSMPGAVTALSEPAATCALLADGSVLCPGRSQFIPLELAPREVMMSVRPRQLRPGQRAAIHFVKLGDISVPLTARIEVFGDGAADVSSYYRLLGSSGTLLVPEPDANSALLTGSSPMGWLEAQIDGRGSRLYVRPIELQRESGGAASIRMVAQPVELVDGLYFTASTDTLSEGGEELQLSIALPAVHAGLRVELTLAANGTALADSDYTLVTADPAQGIALSRGAADEITLRVEPAPIEPLRLLLRPRGDDSIGQGERSLSLRISSYQVFPESAETVDLPAALDFSIVDDDDDREEPRSIQQLQFDAFGAFGCVLLNDGSVHCVGEKSNGRTTPPDDLGRVTQLAVGRDHVCAVVGPSGQVRCWGNSGSGRTTPPADLDQVVQLASGGSHSCALTALGVVHCWGDSGQSSPPASLGPDGELVPVAEIGVGNDHSCALTTSGQVRCWGKIGNPEDQGDGDTNLGTSSCVVPGLEGVVVCGSDSTPLDDLGLVTQLAVGGNHSCAIVSGAVFCWGDDAFGQSTPPVDLDPVAEIDLGWYHSCARTMAGVVHCWGFDEDGGQATPPAELGPDGALGPAVQLELGWFHSCARVESGRLHCWGEALDPSSLPPHLVTAVEANGDCALLAEGSVYCPGRQSFFPFELSSGDVVMSVLPRQLLPGQRAAIRFTNLHLDTGNALDGVFSPPFEVFGDGAAEPGRDYRLLDSGGTLLVPEPDGSYKLGLALAPMAWLESLVADRSLFVYVRPLFIELPNFLQPEIRKVALPVELTIALAKLRVSVPAGELLQLPAIGTDTVTVDVRVEAMDAMDMPVNSTGLLLVAEPIAGSVRHWSPSVAQPAALSATGETGVFEGRLRVTLDTDDTAAELRIGVIGFPQAQGIAVETTVVRVLQSLSFIAAASMTTEGADDLELQIGMPLGHVGLPVEIELSLGGTALYDSDYTLVASETSGSVSIDETDSGVILRLMDVPDTPLRLLLRPRPNDVIRQGDRRAELQLSGYRVDGVQRSADALPTTLGVTIFDPYLPVTQRLLDVASGAACVLLDEDNEDMVELRCWTVADAAVGLRTVLTSTNILSARQLAFGEQHVCWLQQDRQVVCDGSGSSDRVTVPDDLGTTPTVAVVAGPEGSCAVDENGAVRCWGEQAEGLPANLGPVTQLSIGDDHGCALHADGVVSCWGDNAGNKATPPDDLEPVLQLALGYEHSCALTVAGEVRCWGTNMLPVDLGLATQLTSGANHSCALLEDGEVLCWGANSSGQLNVPSLPPSGVKSLVAGGNSSCALLAEGSVRCWGGGLESAVPAELQPDDVAVSVLPQRLLVGQRAAIRFADLRGGREAPAVRIELLDDTAQFGIDYRLLDAAGQPLSAEPDGRYLLAGNTQPAAYIEALPDPRGRRLRTLYVLALETVPAVGSAPSLRRAAQLVELVNPAAFVGRFVVQMHGGAEQLLTADKMVPILLRLSLTNIDGSPLDEPLVLTAQLRGMVDGDATMVPAEPFEIIASGIGVTTEVMVILGDSGETTVQFTVSEPPPGAVVVLSPTVLRVTLLSGSEPPINLDVTEDDSVGTEDVILLIQFRNAGRSGILPPALVPRQQRLEDLMPLDVVDLRLDLDGNNTVDMTDLRIILRYLAGLRDAALGEGVEQEQVEEVLRPQPNPSP